MTQEGSRPWQVLQGGAAASARADRAPTRGRVERVPRTGRAGGETPRAEVTVRKAIRNAVSADFDPRGRALGDQPSGCLRTERGGEHPRALQARTSGRGL